MGAANHNPDRRNDRQSEKRSSERRPTGKVAGRRARILLGAAAGLGLLSAPAGWIVTDTLEADNDFCNACHLREDVPLHIDIRDDFDHRPAATLAALHGARDVEVRPEAPAFRCIDCHGGVGFLGKLRVKALAGKDAFWYVVGHFEEPTEMRWPLLDDDCRQCHPGFAEKGDGVGGPAFHDLAVHNVELGVGCVECHLSHEKGGNVDAWFLHATQVRGQCARCHEEMAADTAADMLRADVAALAGADVRVARTNTGGSQ